MAFQQRADGAVAGEDDGPAEIVACQSLLDRADDATLRGPRCLPALDRLVGMLEEGVGQLLEALARNKTGTGTVVLAKVIPALHRGFAQRGKTCSELESLGFPARHDAGDAPEQGVVRESFRARLSDVGKAPARDGHIGVLHHLRVGDVEAVAHQMPPREKWVSSRTIWPTFHLMLASFGSPFSSNTSG